MTSSRSKNLDWRWPPSRVNLICHTGCGTKTSKFQRHTSVSYWIRAYHPSNCSKYLPLKRSFQLTDNVIRPYAFDLIPTYLQDTRRPTALRSPR